MAYPLNQHEYQVYENGAWSASRQTNMTLLPDGRHRISGLIGIYATGHVRVRVMAIGSNPPSDWLISNAPFTGAAPMNAIPVANAGSDSTITAGPNVSVLFNGSGTDSDGTIVSYHWEQVSGPVQVSFSNQSAASPTVSGFAAAGEYIFSLVVTDNSGASSVADQVKITANAAPAGATPPTITSFAPGSGVVGSNVVITGTNFSSTQSVKFGTLAASFVINSATQLTATVPSGLAVGSASQISVQNNGGIATSTGSFTVTVAATGNYNIVAEGNSQVHGTQQDGGGKFITWVNTLRSKLNSSQFTITNLAQNASTITSVQSRAAAVTNLYDPAKTNILIFLEQINSLDQGATVDAYWTQQNNYLNARKAEGYKIMLITGLPFSGSDSTLAKIVEVNQRIRTQGPALFDYIVDISRNLNMGGYTRTTTTVNAADPAVHLSTEYNRYYYDGLHPAPIGHEILGLMIYDDLNKFINNVALPDSTNYPPTVVYPGSPMGTSYEYQAVWRANNFRSAVGTAQRDSSIIGPIPFPNVAGLRGFYEFDLNFRTQGFIGPTTTQGIVYAGYGFVSVQIDNYELIMWEGITQLGKVGSWAAGMRMRIEVWDNKVVFLLEGNVFYTWNKPTPAQCWPGFTMDGGNYGEQADFSNVRQG